MNKKGFISISVVYSFLLVFIAIVFAILAMYTSRRLSMIEIQKDVKNLIDSKSNFDCLSNGITNLGECIIHKYGGEENIVFKNKFSGTVATTSGEYGLYKTLDDYGDSYYFRGDVPDNYVRFGKDEYGVDMYWRIVRINGDGTIRMIYDGIELMENGHVNEDVVIATELFNSEELELVDGVQYINYEQSIVKVVLDSWYEDNLSDNYDEFISYGAFCNDREIAYTRYCPNNTNGITGSDHNCQLDDDYNLVGCQDIANGPCSGNHFEHTFASTVRVDIDENRPKIICSQSEDEKFYKIALLSIDEAALAGGIIILTGNITASNNYLYRGIDFWTMTAHNYGSPGSWSRADMWYISANGNITSTSGEENVEHGVRPVINLVSSMEIKSGKGTVDSPYILKGVN